MADTSASHIIWFIAAVVAASAISGVIVKVSMDMADNIESRGMSQSGSLLYDISIENDVTMVPFNNTTNNLILYLKNVGHKSFSAAEVNSSFILLLTGGNVTNTDYLPSNYSIIGKGVELLPGQTIRLTYNTDPLFPDYQYRIKMLVSGHSEVSDSKYIRVVNI